MATTRDASRGVFHDREDSGENHTEALRVVRAIKDEPMTTREIVAKVGMDVRSGSARVSGLELAGLVYYAEKRKCRVTNREAHVIRPTSNADEFLRTGIMPPQRKTERQLLLDVLAASRELLMASEGEFKTRHLRLKNAVRAAWNIEPDIKTQDSEFDQWKDNGKR